MAMRLIEIRLEAEDGVLIDVWRNPNDHTRLLVAGVYVDVPTDQQKNAALELFSAFDRCIQATVDGQDGAE